MSDYKVTDSELTGIANAIRTKGGTSSPLVFPNGFTSAIEAIPTGGGSTLITKNISANGTYDAEDDDADGYSSVVVNVPSSGADISTDLVFGGPQIPDMTNATTPSGIVSASSYFTSNYEPYMAFNFNIQSTSMLTNSWLASSSDSAPWIMYEFPSAVEFDTISFETSSNAGVFTRTATIEGQKTDDSWENCLDSGNSIEVSFRSNTYGDSAIYHSAQLNGRQYKALRISFDSALYGSGFAGSLNRIQVKNKTTGTIPGIGYYGVNLSFPSNAANGTIYTDVELKTTYQKVNGEWVALN